MASPKAPPRFKARAGDRRGQRPLGGRPGSLWTAQAQLKSSTAVYRQIIGSVPKRLGPARSIEKYLPRSLDGAVALGLKTHPAVTSVLVGGHMGHEPAPHEPFGRTPGRTIIGLTQVRHR